MVLTVVSTPAPARAQVAAGGVAVAPAPYRLNPYFAAPGMYGMMLGSPSYGSVRTYTEFSSPFGGGYGYGYAPYGLLPGRYGVGLWRPGFVAPGYAYGASYYSYRTFALPFGTMASTPPVGLYAPAFGPPALSGW
jgi:hypothetical protein